MKGNNMQNNLNNINYLTKFFEEYNYKLNIINYKNYYIINITNLNKNIKYKTNNNQTLYIYKNNNNFEILNSDCYSKNCETLGDAINEFIDYLPLW